VRVLEHRTSRERPGTFDVLGFTHHWAVSLQKRWYVRRETAKTRLTQTQQKPMYEAIVSGVKTPPGSITPQLDDKN
jgi:hypothetical protein